MADRYFRGTVQTIQNSPIHLYGVVAFTGGGGIASQSKTTGFTFTRNGVGLYQINLEDSYNEFPAIHFQKAAVPGGSPESPNSWIIDIAGNLSTLLTNRIIPVRYVDGTNTLVDPGVDIVTLITIVLKNSSVQP